MTDIALRVTIDAKDKGAEASIRKVMAAVEELSAKARAGGAAGEQLFAVYDSDLPSIDELTAKIEELVGVERDVEQVTRSSAAQFEAAEQALQRMGLSAEQVEEGLRRMGFAQKEVAEQAAASTAAVEQSAQAADEAADAQRRNAEVVEASGKKQEVAAERSRRGLGSLRSTFQQLITTATGLPGVIGRAAGSLSSFAFGGGIAVAVVAGIGAIAAAWRSLTGEIRKNREEAKQTAETFSQQALAARGLDIGRQLSQLRDREDDLRSQLATLDRPAGLGDILSTRPVKEALDGLRDAVGLPVPNRRGKILNELNEVALAADRLRDSATDLRAEVPQAFEEALGGRLEAEQQRIAIGAEELVRVASIAFAGGRTSVEEFFAARRQALESGFAAELRIAQANADNLGRRAAIEVAKDPRSPAAIQALAAAEQQRLAIGNLQLQQDSQRNALAAERTELEKGFARTRRALQTATFEAQGEFELAAGNAILDQIQSFRTQLLQENRLTVEEIEKLLAALQTPLANQLDVQAVARQVGAAFAETDRLASEIQARVEAGLITERQGVAEVIALQRSRVGVLQELRKRLDQVALSATDPQSVEAIRALRTELDNATIAAGATGRAAIDLQLAFAEVVESELGTFLAQTVFDAKNAGDAFRSFASGVIDDINRIVSRIIAAEIVGALGFAGGGAVPQRLATGGLVYGPRYPVDRVPSWLTGGEYVFDTKSVGRAGLPFMRTLHAFLSGGLTPPAVIQRNRMPGHFAEGGIVNSGAGGRGGGSDRLRAEFDVSPDLVLRNLESTDGVRALVRIMASNPKTFNSALRG